MTFEPKILEGFDGILFIGDVHLLSHRPGRRIDDYASAGIDKLRQCARIANERNLFPVCLGDLFHRARENDLVLLSRTMEVLREFKAPLLLLAGSHDRTESWFTNQDAGQLLDKSGVLQVIEHPGKVVTLRMHGRNVNLWATPAGCRVAAAVAAEPGGHNIMVTHHDFDFNGMYPGAEELSEIENCELLVNGHMHTPTPMVIKGGTACHNPGSIMRVSVDLKKHKPVVSVWTPAHGASLEAIPLVVADNVFDMTGKEAFAADPRALKDSLPKGLRLSTFAAKLRGADSLEAARTDDGAVLVEELDAYFKLFDKPDNLKRYLTGLVGEVVSARLATPR